MRCSPCKVGLPYELLTVGVHSTARVLLLSRLCGVRTHFKGSTFLCPGDGCGACASGRQSKFHGYVAVYDGKRPRLFRMTESSSHVAAAKQLIVPGLVWQIEKSEYRRAVVIRSDGPLASWDSSSEVSDVALFGLVVRLHGLGSLDDALDLAQAESEGDRRARLQIDRMLLG